MNQPGRLSALAERTASHGRSLGIGAPAGTVVAWADHVRPVLLAALARTRPNDTIVVALPTDSQA
ncbi:MAG: hypothetical protein ACO33F_02645, partial [Ilumatobacteraceae bacterium]